MYARDVSAVYVKLTNVFRLWKTPKNQKQFGLHACSCGAELRSEHASSATVPGVHAHCR